MKDIVVIYHDQCRDGFASAYAAWRKFGDQADYIAKKNQDPVPEGLTDKELYIIDYSYSKEELEDLRAKNKSVVVIEHHASAEAAVTSFPENVFDSNHSGCVLAWQYFHPGTEVPTLLRYIEDHDLWKHELPHNREFSAALSEYNQDFETWDQLNDNFENKDLFDSFIRHGTVIAGFEDKLIERLLEYRERGRFEGHEIYVLNAERIHRSILGHRLAELNQQEGGVPMAIVYYRYDGCVHVALRSNGEFNVRALAEKYGGSGHDRAASIRVGSFADMPFEFI